MIRFTKASKLNIVLLFVMLVLFALCFTTVDNCIAYAIDTNKFDETYVMDDLNSSTVDGKAFNINDYPFDDSVDAKYGVQVLNFVEYCYSFKANMRDNFGLYLYLWNVKGLNIDTANKNNKVQIAVKYNADGSAVDYEKFDIKFCSKSNLQYDNLFYKFKVVDHKSADGKKIVDRVNSLNRQYDVSSVELVTFGESKAHDYYIGGSYSFSGFSAGYGSDTKENTLTSSAKNLETISLDTNYTFYRTGASSLGATHQNQINSVYFDIDNSILEKYGNLYGVKAVWDEQKTSPILVANSVMYNYFLPVIGKEIPQDKTVEQFLYGGDSYLILHTEYFEFIYNFMSSCPISMVLLDPKKGIDCRSLYYLFPVDDFSKDVVTGKRLLKYINDNETSYGDKLFSSAVDSGRVKGLNTVDMNNDNTSFNMFSYDSTNPSLWKRWQDFGFKKINTSEQYLNIKPIEAVKNADIYDLSDDLVSNKYFVYSNDVQNFRNNISTAETNSKTTYMYRFGVTDYHAFEVHDNQVNIGTSSKGYIAEQTVFRDFDILQLTFFKDGFYRVIPVVANPIDAAADITTPITMPDKGLPDWLKLLLLVLAVIAVVVLFTPFLPYIIQLVIYIIALPFKLIIAIVKACKRNKNKEVKVKDTKPVETKIKQKNYTEQQKPIKYKKQKKQNFRKQKR